MNGNVKISRLKGERIAASVLAVLVVFVMVFGLLAQSVSADEKISDADTSGSYSTDLGDNTSTRYAGRVWTDKTVYKGNATFTGEIGSETIENDSDFLVAYSALATTVKVTGKSNVPVDVVFVIDNSGSMSGDALDETVSAVNQSIDTLMDANEDNRVAVVLYDTDAATLLPLGHYTSYSGDGIYIAYTSSGRYFKNTVKEDVDYNNPQDYRGSLDCGSSRGTNLQLGTYTGMNILATEADTTVERGGREINRVPAVIMLSDGAATYSSSSSRWWMPNGNIQGPGSDSYYGNGMLAMANASYMKQEINRNYEVEADSTYAAKVYTVGMGISSLVGDDKDLAEVTLDPKGKLNNNNNMANSIRTAWDTYSDGDSVRIQVNSGWFGVNSYTMTHPDSNDITTLLYNDAYYSAENADDVVNVFENITSDIVSSSSSVPTEIEGGDPWNSGYLTYTDPIGEYMEVKDIKALIYMGQVFKKKTESTNGNTTTYTFEGEINSPIYGDHDASAIEIEVSEDEQGNQTLTVKMPAGAIPLRENSVTLDSNGAVTENANNGAFPARILYTVGLKASVDRFSLSGVSDSYIENNTEDGKVSFYSNKYSGRDDDGYENTTADGITVGDAQVSFTPAATNPFFYIQEDTPLYLDEECTKPAIGSLNEKTEYWFKITYYEGTKETTTPVNRLGEEFLSGEDNETYVEAGSEGQLHIKAGAPRLGYLSEFMKAKEANATGTAASSFYPVYKGNGEFVVYLGNNGQLQLDAPESLTVKKQVTSDEGLTAPEDAKFNFEVTIANKSGKTGAAVKTGNDGTTEDITLDFNTDGKCSFTLKDGESMEILNVGEKTAYTVEEVDIPDGFEVTGGDSVRSGTVSSQPADNIITYTNKYKVSPLTSDDISLTLDGRKDISGRSFKQGDEFTFTLEAAQFTPNAPLPQKDGQQVNSVVIKPDSGTSEEFAFDGSITFSKPGEYRYIIRETVPAQGISGVSYDSSIYRLSLWVVDNGNGTLRLATAEEAKALSANTNIPIEYNENPYLQKYAGGQFFNADSVVFTNSYSAEEAKTAITGEKILKANNSSLTLGDGMFKFKIEALGYNMDGGDTFSQSDENQPLPAQTEITNIANGDVAFGEMTFDQSMIGRTYGYKITEVLPQGVTEDSPTLNGITYDTEEKIVKVTVGSSSEGGEHVTVNVEPADNEGNNFTFTNSYEPSPVSADINVQKTLTGRENNQWLDSDSFSYTLKANTAGAPGDGKVITVSKPGSGNVSSKAFENIKFTEAGTYEYEITEENAGNVTDGISYDSHSAKVTVKVTEDSQTGVLSAEVTYDNRAAETEADRAANDAAAFTNKYSAAFSEDTAVDLSGTKTLVVGGNSQEKLEAGEFYFIIEPQNSAPMGEGGKLIPVGQDNGDGSYTGTMELLKNVKYTEAGTYEYIIREQIPSDAQKRQGMTYDETVYKVTVSVSDNNKGELKASKPIIKRSTDGGQNYGDADSVTFTNIYEPLELSVTPVEITKELTGRQESLKAGEFTFEMSVDSAEPKDGVALPGGLDEVTAANDANGKVQFGNITFSKVGKYVIKIRELNPVVDKITGVEGVVYDTHEVKITYEVRDDSGQLVATRNAPDSRTFINEYKAEGTLAGPEVSKNFEGKAWTDEEFTFTLKADKTDENTVRAFDEGTVKFLDEASQPVEGTESSVVIKSDTADHKAKFRNIWFGKAGTYKFVISEVQGNDDNIAYSAKSVPVTVTVTDNDGKGTLTATATYGGDLTFTNEFTPDVETVSIKGSKLLAGREPKESDSFTFNIEALDGAPEPAVSSVTVKGSDFKKDGDGKWTADINLGSLTFNKAGEYEYVITESDANISAVSCDAGKVNITVKVDYDETTGEFSSDVAYSKDGGEANSGSSFSFTNKYEAAPTDTVTGFNAKKKVTASEGNSYTLKDGEFSFTLTPGDGNPAGDPIREAITASNDADGNVTFTNGVVYSETGTYVYTVKEEQNSLSGISYDSDIYTITVEVSDADGSGKLTAEKSVKASDGSPVESILFSNGYEPKATSASIGGMKTLEGNELTEGMFSFKLTSVDGAPMPEGSSNGVKTVENTASGEFGFGSIEYKKTGEFKYKVSEVKGSAAGYTYDGNTYDVTVKVTDEGGELKAAVSKSYEDIKFKNSYAPLPYTLKGEIKGSKSLTGRELAGGEFLFQLKDGNKVLAEAKNDAEGSFAFSGIKLEKAGTYNWSVVEKNNGLGGVEYDETVYNVQVRAEDDNGYIKITDVTYMRDGEEADELQFSNEYQAQPVSVSLGAVKRLEGRDMKAGEFTFQLKDSKEHVVSTAENGQNGSIAFDSIEFDKPGTYKYTVSEIAGNDENVKYDDKVYDVTVKVTDGGKGYLKAEVNAENGSVIFTNLYDENVVFTKTGDDTPLAGALALMIISLTSAGIILVRRKAGR